MFSTTYGVLLHANLNVSELKGRLLGIFFRIIKMNVTEQYRFFFLMWRDLRLICLLSQSLTSPVNI